MAQVRNRLNKVGLSIVGLPCLSYAAHLSTFWTAMGVPTTKCGENGDILPLTKLAQHTAAMSSNMMVNLTPLRLIVPFIITWLCVP